MTFEFSYVIEYDFDLDYDDIGSTAEGFALAADETTGFDREAWIFSLRGDEVSVSFSCEGCRDRFIEIYGRDRVKPTDNAPVPSTKRTRGRSHPVCD